MDSNLADQGNISPGVYVAVKFFVFVQICILTFRYLRKHFVNTMPEPVRLDSEKSYFDPSKSVKIPFPSLDDPHSISLSVIVPAYNEEKRLRPMLDECLQYLLERKRSDKTFSFEVIIVDDGSTDKTTKVALEYSAKHGTEQVRVLTLAKNRGKGGAVKLGMYSSRGLNLLFADADGATKFSDLSKLLSAFRDKTGDELRQEVVIGSRAHLEEAAIAERSALRTLLMRGFHLLVWLLCVRGIRDTQCGFKVFHRRTARLLFSNLHVNRWAFDVELLYIAQALKVQIHEVAVNWTEIEGSKIVPVWSWVQMGLDLILIWLKHTLGIWTIVVDSKRD